MEDLITTYPNHPQPQDADDLFPIALLMDELKHDDVASRVQAMKRIDTIAIALGPERTRAELIPYLEENVPEDEDEIAAIVAEEYGKFVPLVGGPEYAPLLIPLLQKISACEEPVVREKAVESLNLISESLSDAQIIQEFIPLIEVLSKEKWFSLHMSATGLFKSVLTRVDSELRTNLLHLYFTLIQEDSPLVKKAGATNLPEIIDLLAKSFNTPQTIQEFNWDLIYEMYLTIVKEQQDSVRFLAVDILISILAFLKEQKDETHIKNLFQSLNELGNDPSWRVRYMVADRFEKLALNFNDKDVTLELVPMIVYLMKDNEAEVRKAISKQLPGFCRLVNEVDSNVVLEEIVPVVADLSKDGSETVRSALASEVTGLTPILGKEDTINHLVPIFVHMLTDEFSEVRLNIISNLQVVNEIVGIKLLSNSLLPAITGLANDKLWRVRLAIIQQIPLLAEQLGVAFFEQELGQLCMDWLWDPVYSIREAAVLNLQKLTSHFGEEWAKPELIDRLLAKQVTPDFQNFIFRITCLFALTKLVPVLSNELVVSDIYPFIDNLKTDQVPNIRFNVAKSLSIVAEKLITDESTKNIVTDEIIPSLETLSNDEDIDVRFFTEKSLDSIKKLLDN